MRTVGIIIRTGWNQLNGIAAKHRQVAEVLLPGGQVPGVVRVALGAIPQLVPAQRILGSGGDIQLVPQAHSPPPHSQLAEQISDAEQNAALIVAKHHHRRIVLRLPDAQPVTLRCARRRRWLQTVREWAGDFMHRRTQSHGDHRNVRSRPLGHLWPADVSALLHFFDQHLYGLLLSRASVRRRDNHRVAQIERMT